MLTSEQIQTLEIQNLDEDLEAQTTDNLVTFIRKIARLEHLTIRNCKPQHGFYKKLASFAPSSKVTSLGGQ